jgi:hypothetical protein
LSFFTSRGACTWQVKKTCDFDSRAARMSAYVRWLNKSNALKPSAMRWQFASVTSAINEKSSMTMGNLPSTFFTTSVMCLKPWVPLTSRVLGSHPR